MGVPCTQVVGSAGCVSFCLFSANWPNETSLVVWLQSKAVSNLVIARPAGSGHFQLSSRRSSTLTIVRSYCHSSPCLLVVFGWCLFSLKLPTRFRPHCCQPSICTDHLLGPGSVRKRCVFFGSMLAGVGSASILSFVHGFWLQLSCLLAIASKPQ